MEFMVMVEDAQDSENPLKEAHVCGYMLLSISAMIMMESRGSRPVDLSTVGLHNPIIGPFLGRLYSVTDEIVLFESIFNLFLCEIIMESQICQILGCIITFPQLLHCLLIGWIFIISKIYDSEYLTISLNLATQPFKYRAADERGVG
ncbi:hypothetical protein DVH24_007789 [Malus domestica]|uniref:Uncharacterized protein n=1 Tax=Malus domestica TaxID=3750 RepID=A0A498JU53_MALDO|nr:hypothetical protein DVH24_007789 [Malus domestica]